MKKRLIAVLLIGILCVLLSGCGVTYVNPYEEIPNPVATVTMSDGKVMRFTLYPSAAPNTVSNFITLANSGFYDGLKIDYVFPTYYIRGGDPLGDGTGTLEYTIDGEFRQNGFPLEGLTHTRGTISMCRLTDQPDSAGCQFFIMLSNHSANFNGQYAAFGRIDPQDSASFAALDAIAATTLDKSYRPMDRQVIESIRVDTKGYVYEVVKSGETVPEEQ